MGVWYATREDLKSALDFKETAQNNAQIDRAIEAGSRAVEVVTRRRYYPEIDTRYFDYPNDLRSASWRLWLGKDELISVTSVLSGGDAITSYFLEPANDGPPFDRIETDRSSSSAWASGDTPQRSIAITGKFGYSDETRVVTTTAEALDASETGVDVNDSSQIGVGALLTIGTEKMIVTARSSLDTGMTLSGNVAANNGITTVPVTGSGQIHAGERITIGTERMDVEDILGSNLAVRRAVDGSTLAAHSTSDVVYAPRSLTVERGSLGTTASTALLGANVSRQVFPGLVVALCIAEAENYLLQEGSGYARTAGSGENARTFSQSGLNRLREQTRLLVGRSVLSGAV